MKKQYSILSMMVVLTLSFFLVSCGQKKDEALVTDFNSKKTEADKEIATMGDDGKMMMADHAAWNAKLDSASKAGADTAKIAWFKGEMKKMEDMGKGNAMMDSLRAYSNANPQNNDQLKADIAGIDANMAACKSSCDMMMDQHKKLGADIMAFLSSAPASAAVMEAPKTGAKKSVTTTTTTTTTTTPGTMDMSKHPVKPPTNGAPRQGSGTIIK